MHCLDDVQGCKNSNQRDIDYWVWVDMMARYRKKLNLDKTPLPFVVGQYHTFTHEDDKYVGIKYLYERL